MQGQTGDLELDPTKDSYNNIPRHGCVIGIIANIQFELSKNNILNNVKVFLANFKCCGIDIIVYQKRVC
jgi:hypothetical protein